MRRALILLLLILVAAIGALMPAAPAVSQQDLEGSLLSNPAVSSVKMLDISAGMLAEYTDIASGYEPRTIVYIIQDKDKVLRGKVTISFGPVVENGKARTELIKAYEYPFRGRSRLTVNAESLLPVKYTLDFFPQQRQAGLAPGKPAETWTAEYYYDMVAIRVDAGDTGTFADFRRPMKSLDFDELYLLFSQLEAAKLPEKSVVLVTAPFEHRNHAVLVEDKGVDYIYAADAERHACEHLLVTFLDFTEDYYVERTAPYRVVKFTQRGLTFTLQEDQTQRGAPEEDIEFQNENVKHPGDFMLGGGAK